MESTATAAITTANSRSQLRFAIGANARKGTHLHHHQGITSMQMKPGNPSNKGPENPPRRDPPPAGTSFSRMFCADHSTKTWKFYQYNLSM